MKNSNSATTTKITKAFSFITLVILALLVFIQKLLPVVGLNVNGPAIKVLEIITYILTLIIIGINGLCSASKKRDKAESAFWDENLEEKV